MNYGSIKITVTKFYAISFYLKQEFHHIWSQFGGLLNVYVGYWDWSFCQRKPYFDPHSFTSTLVEAKHEIVLEISTCCSIQRCRFNRKLPPKEGKGRPCVNLLWDKIIGILLNFIYIPTTRGHWLFLLK